MKIGLLDCRAKILKKKVLPTQSFTDKTRLIQALVSAVSNIIIENNIRKSDISGMGLGVPGPVDVSKGIVYFFPNIPGWKNVRLKEILEKKLGIKVLLDNDANLMCLAEFKLGAGIGFSNVIGITLGTGVGGGIIIEGRLYRGATFNAGEAGHMPLNETGPKCACGGRACLESYIGNNKILKEVQRVFGKRLPLELIDALAARKNKQAIAIWSQVGAHLGIALTGIVNLLNPDAIVIGGGVAKAGEVLFSAIRKTVLARAMPVQARHAKILAAKLGSDAGIIGAGLLVKEGA